MNNNVIDFRGALDASQRTDIALQQYLLANIAGARGVHKAHPDNDRLGCDFYVEAYGKHLAVDAKVREEEKGDDDLALEHMSVVDPYIVGWTLDDKKITDYILFHWKDSGRCELIPARELRAAFAANLEEWLAAYQNHENTSYANGRTWNSRCVYVPRLEVWRAIHRLSRGSVA
jgi:hypothetical protein